MPVSMETCVVNGHFVTFVKHFLIVAEGFVAISCRCGSAHRRNCVKIKCINYKEEK